MAPITTRTSATMAACRSLRAEFAAAIEVELDAVAAGGEVAGSVPLLFGGFINFLSSVSQGWAKAIGFRFDGGDILRGHTAVQQAKDYRDEK